MKKVLLIGPDFHGYNNSYKRALIQNGFEVSCYESNIEFTNQPFIMWGLCRASSRFRKIYCDFLKRRENNFIKSEFKQFKPNFVLILKGDMVYKETIEKMKKQSIISLVTTDSLANTKGGLDTAKAVNFCYVFEGTDVKKYQAEVPNMQFMPIGYDDEIYHPISRKKDIDIFFVGNVDEKRALILKSLIRDFPDLIMQFYGMGISHVLFWKYIAFKLSKESKYIFPYGLEPKEVNELYARSKICLNILNDQSIVGWNPRTNEILGAGCFELVSENIAIKSEFKGCLVMYNSYEDLKQKIIYYLNHEEERNSIVKQGHNLVKAKHTFKNRVKRIISDWNSVSL